MLVAHFFPMLAPLGWKLEHWIDSSQKSLEIWREKSMKIIQLGDPPLPY